MFKYKKMDFAQVALIGRTIFFIFFAALFLTACAEKVQTYTYFPPDPEPPRYQFLTSFSSGDDLRSNRFLKELTGDMGTNRLARATGVAFHQGTMIVADAAKNGPGLAIFDIENRKFKFINTGLQKPNRIYTDQDGLRYISDLLLNSVIVLDINNKPFKKYRHANEKSRPSSALVIDNRVYVSDVGTHQIHIFDKNSAKLIKSFGKESGLGYPADISYDEKNSRLIVPESISARVSIFSLDGKLLDRFGDAGDKPGSFVRPKGSAVDKQGNIYVTDVAFQNFQIFNEDKKVLMFIAGGTNEASSLQMPGGITINYDSVPYFQKYAAPGFNIEYLVAVTAQGQPPHFGSKVNIYGFGRMEGADYSAYE